MKVCRAKDRDQLKAASVLSPGRKQTGTLEGFNGRHFTEGAIYRGVCTLRVAKYVSMEGIFIGLSLLIIGRYNLKILAVHVSNAVSSTKAFYYNSIP